MWYTATTASVSNGSTIVQILAGDDISIVQEDGGLIFEGESPVQIKRGYSDGSGNNFIELQKPWPYTDKSSQPLVAYPTDGSFAEATIELRRVIDGLSVASVTEMQTGTDNEKISTPLGVKAAIDFNTGTAASKDVVTSNTDSTAGRLLTVGYGSLGTNLIAISDPNSVSSTTKNRLSATASGIGNMPEVGFYAIDTQNYDANSGHQLAKNLFSREMFHRSKASGVWDAEWLKIYHSGNTNFNEFGGLAENKVLATGTMFTSTTARFYLPINSKVQPSSITTVGGFRVVTSQTIIATDVSVSMSFPTSERMVVLDVTVPSTAIGTPVNLRGETASSKITVNY